MRVPSDSIRRIESALIYATPKGNEC